MKLISQPSRETRQMVQCLELYYKQGRSQKDIAVALGVSAATVSRLLKRAMDDGLVRVELDLPRTEELETGLVQTYGLREAVVVASGGRGDLRAELGAAAAAYFEKVAENGMRIGLSCGLTLYHTIHSLRERRLRDLALYPLSGESTLKLVDIFANTLVGMMAAKYRPHVRAYALPVQHLLSLKEIERERRRLVHERPRHRRGRGHRPPAPLAAGTSLAGGAGHGCLLEGAHPPELLVALRDQRLAWLGLQLGQLRAQHHAQPRGGAVPVAVRAAHRLRHDAVDDAQTQQLGGRGAHGLRRLRRLGGITPEDRRAALGRDHGVDGVLEHQHAVAHADGQGAAAAALARHHGHDRGRQRRHAPQIARDRLRLAALLGAQPRIGAGRVDEREDGLAELRGQLHEAQGLAIALGVRHPEVARDLLARVAPLLVTDHDHRLPIEAREAADDGRIVAEQAVAVQLGEFLQQQLAPVARVGTLGVPRQLRALPGREAGVRALAAHAAGAAPQASPHARLVQEIGRAHV